MVSNSDLVCREALKIVEKEFEDYACRQQDFLGEEQLWNQVLAIIPSEGVLDCSFLGTQFLRLSHMFKCKNKRFAVMAVHALMWRIVSTNKHFQSQVQGHQ